MSVVYHALARRALPSLVGALALAAAGAGMAAGADRAPPSPYADSAAVYPGDPRADPTRISPDLRSDSGARRASLTTAMSEQADVYAGDPRPRQAERRGVAVGTDVPRTIPAQTPMSEQADVYAGDPRVSEVGAGSG